MRGRLHDGTTPDRFFIQLGTLIEAEELVSNRHKLKGTGFCLLDVLTDDEQRIHNLLWPRFVEARDTKREAQFNRARLYIDKVEVLPGALTT